MSGQLELLNQSRCVQSNVIDARHRFQDRAFQWVRKAIVSKCLPPQIDGKVIVIPKRGAA